MADGQITLTLHRCHRFGPGAWRAEFVWRGTVVWMSRWTRRSARIIALAMIGALQGVEITEERTDG